MSIHPHIMLALGIFIKGQRWGLFCGGGQIQGSSLGGSLPLPKPTWNSEVKVYGPFNRGLDAVYVSVFLSEGKRYAAAATVGTCVPS